MQKNIPLLYILSFLGSAYVWMAIWAYYYLRVTDYTGIAIIEMIAFATILLFEIPSGAAADIFGKKKSLMLGYFFLALGNFLIFSVDSFLGLSFAVVIMSIGFTFTSGAFEALTYESLKQLGKEEHYENVFAKQEVIRTLTYSACALAGGFIYIHWSVGAPFWLTSIFLMLAFLAAMFLREPEQATSQYMSRVMFLQKTMSGIHTLFKQTNLKHLSWAFLLIGFVPLIMYEYAGELMYIDKGALPEQMGIIIALYFISSAVGSAFAPRITRRFGHMPTYWMLGMIYFVILIATPWLGLLTVILFTYARIAFATIHNIIESKLINDRTDSAHRATTLSSLSMLRAIPFALTVTFMGMIADASSVSWLVFILGLVMAILFIIAYAQYRYHRARKTLPYTQKR